MKKHQLFKPAVLVLAVFLLPLGGCGTGESRYSAEFGGVFDTFFTVTGYAKSEDGFIAAADKIESRLTELHRLFDIYHEYEGINNLYTVNQNAGIAPVAVAPEIIGLLKLAREGYELSDGAVDITMGPVLRLWHEARAEGTSIPPAEALREAAKLSGIEKLIIDENTVFLSEAGMSLDAGALAKGYAAGLAIREAEGINALLLNAGGSVTAAGTPPNEWGTWRIGIQNPDLSADGTQTYLDVVNGSGLTVSCSGGYQRFYTVDGKVYHHIIDPVTLMPADRYKQVAVLHPDAGIADILSTALFILPVEAGFLLAEEFDAEALWIDASGSWQASDGYKDVSRAYQGDSNG